MRKIRISLFFVRFVVIQELAFGNTLEPEYAHTAVEIDEYFLKHATQDAEASEERNMGFFIVVAIRMTEKDISEHAQYFLNTGKKKKKFRNFSYILVSLYFSKHWFV